MRILVVDDEPAVRQSISRALALEGYDVSADGKELYTGEFIMTKKNMDEPDIREKFDPEYQAKRTIQTPNYKKK